MLGRERISKRSYVPPWVQHEHAARFRFCAQWASGSRVVDCATGSAAGAEFFRSNGAVSVIAIDRSFGTLLQSVEHAGIHLVCATAINLPLPSEAADLFVSLETIEHLDDTEQYLREAARVTRSDGVFICSTPNRTITNPSTTMSDKPFNRFHVREYAAGEFVTMLSTYFGAIALFGQNPQSSTVVRIISAIAGVSPHCAVVARQLMKIPRLMFASSKRCIVTGCVDSTQYEYLVAMCSKPMRPQSS